MQADQPPSNSIEDRLRFVDKYKQVQKRNVSLLAGGVGAFLLLALINGFRPGWNMKGNLPVSIQEPEEEALWVEDRDTTILHSQPEPKFPIALETQIEKGKEEEILVQRDSPETGEFLIPPSIISPDSSLLITQVLDSLSEIDSVRNPPQDLSDRGILDFADKMPSFPGGFSEMDRYINWELAYPALAKEYLIEGLVFVQFTVEKDGVLRDVEVATGIGYGCDEEAMRIVENMPSWYPGEHEGQRVPVRYTLPINFSLPQ